METYERRTPRSRDAHRKAVDRVPLGVASNYRYYPPYPLFVKEGHGGHFHDVDGNEYIDHNLCYGALMAGHCHPAVMRAVQNRLQVGTLFGMRMTWNLNWQRRFARASRWIWSASAIAARK